MDATGWVESDGWVEAAGSAETTVWVEAAGLVDAITVIVEEAGWVDATVWVDAAGWLTLSIRLSSFSIGASILVSETLWQKLIRRHANFLK